MRGDVRWGFWVGDGDVDHVRLELMTEAEVGDEGGVGDREFAAAVYGLRAEPRLEGGDDEIVRSDESVGLACEGEDEVAIGGGRGAAIITGLEKVGGQRLEQVGANQQSELGVGKGCGFLRWKARECG